MRSLTAPPDLRKEVLERDHHECQYCSSGENVDVHHINSVRNGGEHEKDNLVSLCRSCHKISHSTVPDGEHPVDIMADEGVPTEYVDDERVSRWTEPVLNKLKNGRATPTYIHEQTDVDRGRVNTCLGNMVTAGWATKLSTGLYEITDKGREEVGHETTLDAVRDDLKRALETREWSCVEDAAARLDVQQ